MHKEGLFKLPGGMSPRQENIISLNKEEFTQALIDYFGHNKDYKLSISEASYIIFLSYHHEIEQ